MKLVKARLIDFVIRKTNQSCPSAVPANSRHIAAVAGNTIYWQRKTSPASRRRKQKYLKILNGKLWQKE